MDPAQVISAIEAGYLDLNLDAIQKAIQNRKAVKTKILFYALKPGDKVKLKNISPKYLVGVTATVKRVRTTTLTVDLDEPQGRFHKSVVCRPETVEKVS